MCYRGGSSHYVSKARGSYLKYTSPIADHRLGKTAGQARGTRGRFVRRPDSTTQAWLPRSPSTVVLTGGIVWVVLLGTGALGSAEASTFAALGAVALITTITGLRWYRPALRWPWWCICAALVLFLVGGAAREQLGTLGDLSTHRSLIPDAITIPGYVLLALALGAFGHARRRGRSGDVDAILDATVAALAALSLAWVFLIGPVAARRRDDTSRSRS